MILDIQFKLKQNPYFIKHIRENSYWYKILTRYPEQFKNFEEEVKTTYQLRPSDRLSKALEYVEMLQTIMSTLK